MGLDEPDSVDWWSLLRPVAYFLAWFACVGAAVERMVHARNCYDDTSRELEWRRPNGNYGHTHIDFGGQWVMGRMVVMGHARELYDRNRQWEAARSGYLRSQEPPALQDLAFPFQPDRRAPDGDYIRHDADNLLLWFMGKDSPRWDDVSRPMMTGFLQPYPFVAAVWASEPNTELTLELVEAVTAKPIGGPLYPPIHGFLYAPLGLLDPADAYLAFQCFSVALTFVAGLAVSVMSRRKIWWPIATAVIFLYPGYRSGLDLGQNQVVTLTIVLWGWALASRGHNTAGGMVWGLLAFKPVWALAFLMVPLLMRRWRFFLTMCATGAGLILATLPFTGIQTWFDWLSVGKIAADLYKVNDNWVHLSRDLQGIPSRLLLDFKKPEQERTDPTVTALGLGLLAGTLVLTAVIYLFRGGRREPTGLAAGFLFLGAYLGCYRFMYYDVLLSLIGIFVLWADPLRFFRYATDHLRELPFGPRWLGYALTPPIFWCLLLLLAENVLFSLQPQATFAFPGVPRLVADASGGSSWRTPQLTAQIEYRYPWDTLMVLALWSWCGWRLLWGTKTASVAS